MIHAIRSTGARGDAAVTAAAENLDVDPRWIRIAVDYGAEHLDEIEGRLHERDEALARARALAEGRAALLHE